MLTSPSLTQMVVWENYRITAPPCEAYYACQGLLKDITVQNCDVSAVLPSCDVLEWRFTFDFSLPCIMQHENSAHDSHDHGHGQLVMVMIIVAILSQLQKESNQEAVLQPKAIHPPPLEC